MKTKLSDEVKVSLVTAVCLITLAIISKNVLKVQIDYFSLYIPSWMFIVYIISKDRTNKSKNHSDFLPWSIAIIVATIAILVLYAI